MVFIKVESITATGFRKKLMFFYIDSFTSFSATKRTVFFPPPMLFGFWEKRGKEREENPFFKIFLLNLCCFCFRKLQDSAQLSWTVVLRSISRVDFFPLKNIFLNNKIYRH